MGSSSDETPGVIELRPEGRTVMGDSSRTDVADGAAASSEYPRARHLEPGETVGRYKITDRVGGGSMGMVYAAHDPELDRQVAIKVLHPDVTRRPNQTRQHRMLREARAMAKLTHPNVVTVHDVGIHEQGVFVAMELVEGTTLTKWLESKARSWREVVDVFVHAGRGVQAAHGAGLIHRDFKPDNVMLAEDGRVLVMDFGLARASDGEESTERDPSAVDMQFGSASDKLTRTGALLGTPAYMAPEQYLARPATAASDQFSFCVALHEALYGVRPFAGDNPAEVAASVTAGRVQQPPTGSARVPRWVRRALLRGLQPFPGERWPNMRALVGALERGTARRRRYGVAAGTLVVAVTVATAVAVAIPSANASVCEGGPDRFDAVWTAPRRAELQTAFVDSSIGFAAETWSKLDPVIDEVRTHWVTQYVDACEATNVRQVQSQDLLDRRMICLNRRLTEFDAALTALLPVDATSAKGAVETTAAIVRRVDGCGDTEAMIGRASRPDDPAVAEQVDALRDSLAVIEVSAMRHREQAVAQLRELLAAARVIGFEPAIAETEYVLASWLQEVAKFDEAEKRLKSAHYAARATGFDRISAESASRLMGLYSGSLGDFESAEHWREQADVEVRRYGKSTRVEGRYLDQLGSFQMRRGEFDAAIASHRAALVVWEKVDGPDGLDTAVSAFGLANALLSDEQYQRAKSYYERAHRIWIDSVGQSHPHVGESLGALANVNSALGDADAARDLYRRSLEVRRIAHGPRHPSVAASLHGLANLREDRGDLEGAIQMRTEAIEIMLESRGERHPLTVVVRESLADDLHAAERFADALVHHRATTAAQEAMHGPDDITVAVGLTDEAVDLVALDRAAEAIPMLERSLKIRADRGGAADGLVRTRFTLARALWSTRADRTRATALARIARETIEPNADIDPRWRSHIEAWLEDPSAHDTGLPRVP